MGRFFCALALCALLIFALQGARREPAQSVFFSLLFPQLSPDFCGMLWEAATPGEAQRLNREEAFVLWL